MAQKKTSLKDEGQETKRYRNYVAVVYEDSAPENWRDILSEQHIPLCISPYHDQDKTAMGESKKPHYHVMLCFDAPKTPEQAKEVFASINAVVSPKKSEFIVNSLRAMARYFCHLDNPDKAQYQTEDVRCMAGLDYFALIGLASDKYRAIGEMMDFCRANQIISFAELMMYCKNERYDWFRCLCDNASYCMSKFLRSLEYDMGVDIVNKRAELIREQERIEEQQKLLAEKRAQLESEE